MDELRKKLQQFLNEKDMSFQKASIYFGVSAGALNSFLNDKNKGKPNERTLYKIRKGLGLVEEAEKPR